MGLVARALIWGRQCDLGPHHPLIFMCGRLLHMEMSTLSHDRVVQVPLRHHSLPSPQTLQRISMWSIVHMGKGRGARVGRGRRELAEGRIGRMHIVSPTPSQWKIFEKN